MINQVQDYNPITGDTQLNPAAFGLNMGDIDNENLRTQIQSGRVLLTSDQYKELNRISYEKFQGLDQYGRITKIVTGNVLPVEDLVEGEDDPGLYMSQQRLGFWDGNNRKSFISNAGDFQFGTVGSNNFLEWDQTAGLLTIKGDIVATSVSAKWIYGGNIHGDQIEAGTVSTTALNFSAVESGNIIGTINASEEGITIDADNITISGTTTFDNGYDPSTKETPAGAQSKADGALSSANGYTDTLEGSLGTLAYDNIVEIAKLGTTVIDGGYIKSNLIEVGAIVIGDISGGQDALDDIADAQGKNKVFRQASTVAPTGMLEGDTWIKTDLGDKIYTYDGLAWIQAYTVIDGGHITTGLVSADRLEVGSIFIGDISGGQTALDNITNAQSDATQAISDAASAQAAADGKIVSFYQETEPTTGSEGDIWFDTNDGNKIYTYLSGVWIETQDSQIAQALLNASDAQATADGKVLAYYQDTEPVTGSDGDIWIDTNDGNKFYMHNGTSWLDRRDTGIAQAIEDAAAAAAIADGKIVSFHQDTEPTTGSEGDIWFDTNDGNKIYTHLSGVWTETQDSQIAQALLNASDAQATADGKVLAYYQDAEPVTGSDGDIWIDTNDGNKFYMHNGTSWIDRRDTGIAQAIADAASAQAAVDGVIESFYQDTEPTTGSEGDIWFDTNDGNKIYVYNSGLWVVSQDSQIAQAISDASNAQATADGKVKTFYNTTAPTADGVGDLWYDTDDYTLYRWSGSAWNLVSDVTSNKTSNDTSNVDNVSASTIRLYAERARDGLDTNGYMKNFIDSSKMSGTAPTVAGTYITDNYLGYRDGSAWRSYIGSDGKFAFRGDAENYFQYTGTNLEFYTKDGSLKVGTSSDFIKLVRENNIPKIQLEDDNSSGSGGEIYYDDDDLISNFTIRNKSSTLDDSLNLECGEYAKINLSTLSSEVYISGSDLDGVTASIRVEGMSEYVKLESGTQFIKVDGANNAITIDGVTFFSKLNTSFHQNIIITDTTTPNISFDGTMLQKVGTELHWNGTALGAGGGGGGVTDHGALTGLTDYDHDQYLRKDGSQNMTGGLNTGLYDISTTDIYCNNIYTIDISCSDIYPAEVLIDTSGRMRLPVGTNLY